MYPRLQDRVRLCLCGGANYESVDFEGDVEGSHVSFLRLEGFMIYHLTRKIEMYTCFVNRIN